MARIRTLQFLPEIFKTSTNAQFLGATLDNLVNNPSTTQMQGYVGSKFGYGVTYALFGKLFLLADFSEPVYLTVRKVGR